MTSNELRWGQLRLQVHQFGTNRVWQLVHAAARKLLQWHASHVLLQLTKLRVCRCHAGLTQLCLEQLYYLHGLRKEAHVCQPLLQDWQEGIETLLQETKHAWRLKLQSPSRLKMVLQLALKRIPKQGCHEFPLCFSGGSGPGHPSGSDAIAGSCQARRCSSPDEVSGRSGKPHPLGSPCPGLSCSWVAAKEDKFSYHNS